MPQVDSRRLARWCHSARTELKFLLYISLSLVILPMSASSAEKPPETKAPALLSIFPSIGKRGGAVRVVIRGHYLEGATEIWVDKSGLSSQLLKVEPSKNSVMHKANIFYKKKEGTSPVLDASAEIRVEPNAALGPYALRVVTPRGISDAFMFRVVDEAIATEDAGSHHTVDQAQSVSLPGLIDGVIGKPGEIDYYSFSVKAGQQFMFTGTSREKLDPRSVVSAKFAPQLALYSSTRSWLDPKRPVRLLFEEEKESDLIELKPQGTFRFRQDGTYFLGVSSLLGTGCSDCLYQVRVAPSEVIPESGKQDNLLVAGWIERSFDRDLEAGWIKNVAMRTVGVEDKQSTAEKDSATAAVGADDAAANRETTLGLSRLSTEPVFVSEKEPNEPGGAVPEVAVPCVVEGTISKPGDIDSYKFTVKPGSKLTFEVETVGVHPPIFNPRLGVVDSQDREAFSNVQRRESLYNNNAERQVFLKDILPKVVYNFDAGGTYVLQVRDITTRYGNPNFRYRVLIRQQIPHVGEIDVKGADRLNLVPGQAAKVTITTSYEEGFAGNVSFTFEGLPEGVQALPGTELTDDRLPLEVDVSPAMVAPKNQKTTVVLLATPEARITSKPVLVALRFRPVNNGKVGPSLLVREIPMMVVEAPREDEKTEVGKLEK